MRKSLMVLMVALQVPSHNPKSVLPQVKIPLEVLKIQATVEKLQPALLKTEGQSLQLALAVHKTSTHFKLDWKLLVAVLNQESSLRKDPQGCLKNKDACTGDFGIGQVRKKVWDKEPGMKFDSEKLLTDYDYAITATAKILAHYRNKYSKKELNWYTRYHSRTFEFRSAYQEKLNQSYAKINGHYKTASDSKPVTLVSKNP